MRVVVVGSGPAGLTAAQVVRRHDPAAEVVMLTTEHWPPYSPPAMADHFLTGSQTLFWQGDDVADRLGVVERRGTRVVAVAPERHELTTQDGEVLGYDRLVLASGSRLHAATPGSELPGVHDFKSLDAASAIMARVQSGEARSALIVGNGFIGVELALMLADLGVAVTVVGRRGWVMPRMLDPESAAIAGRAIAARGVSLRLGTEASTFLGDQRAEGVALADGSVLTADLYVAATGVKPHVEYLTGSGIAVGWGVQVDLAMRTTAPDVYAAGDVAETMDRLNGERYVHAIFPNAVAQGEVAARSLLGLPTAYAGAESMNSLKHLGLPIVSLGHLDGDTVIRWGSGDTLRSAWLTDGRLTGVRLVGDIRGAGLYRSLMVRGDDVRRHGRGIIAPGFTVADVVVPVVVPTAA